MTNFKFDEKNIKVQNLLKKLNSSFKMKLFLWAKLPMAAFSGMKVGKVTPHFAEVILPYRWRSQNPFRSIYFAAQCAAAELSTGLLVLAAKENAPPISMLVINFESTFSKKANKTLTFRCEQGPEFIAAIEEAVNTGEGVIFTATSQGILPSGEIASEMKLTWSFKIKKT